MKKFLPVILLACLFFSVDVLAQNVFSPTDPIRPYPSPAPATPPANTLAKWYRTARQNWNTDKFKCYYWNGMAFRLRFPNGYNPADLTTKYPMIVFFHGGGEIGPISDNDYQLQWGAQPFEQKMDQGLFNAFMLFPQITQSSGWDNSYYQRINSVLDSLQKYCNMDQDRVISMGLSNGGFGAISHAAYHPLRDATVISSSPALISVFTDNDKNNLLYSPVWVSSGGKDQNPNPQDVTNFVNYLKTKGGDVRYSYFPNLGHLTWSEQWAEPYLVPYWNSAHKANPLVFFQKTAFPNEGSVNAKLGISAGFAAYQWQKNAVDIPGATSNEYTATSSGSYRVRFKRSAVGNWSDWSPNPAVITVDAAPPPVPTNLAVSFTGSNFVNLSWTKLADNSGAVGYDVFVDGVQKYSTTDATVTADNMLPNKSYAFTVKSRDQAGNVSAASNSVSTTTLNYANGLKYRYYEANYSALPNFTTETPTRTGVTTGVDITNSRGDFYAYLWEGNLNITRAGTYIFETISDDGSRFYFNKTYTSTATPTVNNDGLHASRSVTATVSNIAVGIYPIAISFFENSGGEQMEVWYSGPGVPRQRIPNSAFTSGSDNIAPSRPLNLRAVNTFSNSISLDWDDATDNTTVSGYNVYVNGVQQYTSPTSNITADNLAAGTSYRFTVRAFDPTGNLSDSSAGVTASTNSASSGLQYRYYEGDWLALPNFNQLTPVKSGTTANVDLSVRNRNDYFAFVWEGTINLPVSGTYTFETISDDGSKLYFNTLYSPNATALVNNDGPHGPTSVSASVNATAGSYPIAMTFFENTGGETMQVFFSGPGIPRQPIPNTAFGLPTADATPPSTPTGLKLVSALNNSLSMDWDDATDNIGVSSYDVYVNGVKNMSSSTSNAVISNLTAGTTYAIKVKALDQAGNQSAFSTEIPAATTSSSNGLRYSYYEGEFWAIPDYTSLTPKKTGTTPNIDLGVRSVNDNFSILWEGNITITTPGTYTFETISDDGSKFFFNKLYSPGAVPLVNNDGPHGPTSVSATVNIPQAGSFPIAVAFMELTGGETMQLYYSGPGVARQLVPNNVLTLPNSDATPPSVPGNLRAVYTGRNFAYLDWDASTDNVGVVGYNVYVNGTKKYTTNETTLTDNQLAAGTSYSFVVKAFDVAGNESAASTVTAATEATANGLKYRFYQGAWDALPNFNNLTPVKTGSSANVDLGVRTAGVNDNYAFVWEGYINIKTAGTYTFETISDDGSKLYFKNLYLPGATALVNNDYTHGPNSVSATVNIPTVGLYPISMTFFELGGGETMEIYWSGPGISRQAIPNSAFVETAGSSLITNQVQTTSANNREISSASMNADQAGTGSLEELTQGSMMTKAFPNPFRENLNIQYYNTAAGNRISVDICDLAGRVVFNRKYDNLPAGTSTLALSSITKQLRPGMYTLRLNVNGIPNKIWKVVKAKN